VNSWGRRDCPLRYENKLPPCRRRYGGRSFYWDTLPSKKKRIGLHGKRIAFLPYEGDEIPCVKYVRVAQGARKNNPIVKKVY